MNVDEKLAIAALSAVQIHYVGRAKRFQDAMREKLSLRPDSRLTPRQWQFVRELLHTYRRQVPAHVHERHCPDVKCQRKMKNERDLGRQLCLF